MKNLSDKQHIILVVGAPGSGKSTWAKNYESTHNDIMYLSSDEMRAKFGTGEDDQTVSGKVFAYLKEKTNTLLAAGVNLLIDATNMSRKARKDFINIANKYPQVEKIAVVFEVSKQELLKRNKERGEKGGRNVPEWVIDKMLNNYQKPDNTEFDKILFL
jgi:predicted kinase